MSRPKVITNFAITLDGKISTVARIPSTFSSETDKKRFLEIRAMGDAVMAARGTVEADDMRMTLPEAQLRNERQSRGQSAEPLRVIVTGSGQLDPNLKVFQTEGSPILIVTTTAIEKSQSKQLSQLGEVAPISDPPLDLPKALDYLSDQHGVHSVVCEGGPTLIREFFRADLVTDVYLTVTPWLFGGQQSPTLTGVPGDFLPQLLEFELVDAKQVGQEIFTYYRRRRER